MDKEMMMQDRPDVELEDHGALSILRPVSDAGLAWIEAQTQFDEDSWGWWSGGVLYSPEMVSDMQSDGLEVAL